MAPGLFRIFFSGTPFSFRGHKIGESQVLMKDFGFSSLVFQGFVQSFLGLIYLQYAQINWG